MTFDVFDFFGSSRGYRQKNLGPVTKLTGKFFLPEWGLSPRRTALKTGIA